MLQAQSEQQTGRDMRTTGHAQRGHPVGNGAGLRQRRAMHARLDELAVEALLVLLPLRALHSHLHQRAQLSKYLGPAQNALPNFI